MTSGASLHAGRHLLTAPRPLARILWCGCLVVMPVVAVQVMMVPPMVMVVPVVMSPTVVMMPVVMDAYADARLN